MSDAERSQSQQSSPFAKLVLDHVARAEALYDECGRIEERAFEGARGGIDESARLQKETFAYGALLIDRWRKLSLEAMRRAAAALFP